MARFKTAVGWRTRLRSSPAVTSKREWNPFSMLQWARSAWAIWRADKRSAGTELISQSVSIPSDLGPEPSLARVWRAACATAGKQTYPDVAAKRIRQRASSRLRLSSTP